MIYNQVQYYTILVAQSRRYHGFEHIYEQYIEVDINVHILVIDVYIVHDTIYK